MGMKVVAGAVEGATIMLTQLGERATKHAVEDLRLGAKEIVQTARHMAPIEEGDLRKAIEVTEDRGGINGRTQVIVDINPDAVDERGVSVRWYGEIMNEALEPYGSGGYKLGRASRLLSEAGFPVGGQFMQRALKEHKVAIIAKVTARIKAAFSGSK